MTIYNVRLTIVELIDAPDSDQAIATLRAAVDRAGLTVHDDPRPDVFESEPVDPEHIYNRRRPEWCDRCGRPRP